MTRWLVTAAIVAACSGGKTYNDAAADQFFTGEVVDWDSGTAFCGVFGATLQVHADASRTSSTNPNGRFQLMLAPAATTQLDLAPPTAGSECLAGKPKYQVPGIVVADRDVIAAMAMYSLRMISEPRVATFYQSFGSSFDATKAQVFVHVEGPPHAVSIAAAHQAPQATATASAAWAAGDTGVNVMFPNVDPASSTMLSVAGGATGTGTIPLAAGTFTYATVLVH